MARFLTERMFKVLQDMTKWWLANPQFIERRKDLDWNLPSDHYVVQTTTDHLVTTFADVDIMQGELGSEVVTGELISAYNAYQDIPTGRRAEVHYINGGWSIFVAKAC